jgi:alpha-glucosidase
MNTGGTVIRKYVFALVMAVLSLPTSVLAAQKGTHQTSQEPWWKHAVFYEIYPRSFQDTNGNGVGDLNGIRRRLDYLRGLGIDAIWIAPHYPSPLVDFGYDISNYEGVDPTYGTLADFDRLIKEADKRHIHVLLDMVVNHSSDRHPWFRASASSKTDPKRDWYIWRDGKLDNDGRMGPPNNWRSAFGGSAWTLDPGTNQYYYHRFYAQQPDINWRNPVVEKAMYDQMRFWLDRGVAGFRLDAVDTLLEDPSLDDEDYLRDANGKIQRNMMGEPATTGEKTSNLPEIHAIIRRMRAMIDRYPGDRVLVGETYLPNVQELDKWYGGAAQDELQLPMDTQVAVEASLKPDLFRKRLDEAETSLHGSLPMFVYDNHDNDRLDRYCRVELGAVPNADCNQIQKMLATILFASRSVPLMYYGDEIGMTTAPVSEQRNRRRDSERTPMQWTSRKNADFSTADRTWLPVQRNYKTVNVKTESRQANSLLAWHKSLLALRSTNAVLRDGDQKDFAAGNNNIVGFIRSLNKKQVIVLTNFSGTPQQADMGIFASKKVRVLLSNFTSTPSETTGSTRSLPAYGAFVFEIE